MKKVNNTFDLGTSNRTWRNIFANTLTGTLYGSATCVRDRTNTGTNIILNTVNLFAKFICFFSFLLNLSYWLFLASKFYTN